MAESTGSSTHSLVRQSTSQRPPLMLRWPAHWSCRIARSFSPVKISKGMIDYGGTYATFRRPVLGYVLLQSSRWVSNQRLPHPVEVISPSPNSYERPPPISAPINPSTHELSSSRLWGVGSIHPTDLTNILRSGIQGAFVSETGIRCYICLCGITRSPIVCKYCIISGRSDRQSLLCNAF